MRSVRRLSLLGALLLALLLSGCGKTVELPDGQRLPEDSRELTAVLTAEELPVLDAFPALESADLSGSTCYEEMLAWAEAHPQVALRYTVELPDGSVLDNDAEKADLSELDRKQLSTALPLLRALPGLKTLELGRVGPGCAVREETLAALREAAPGAQLRYEVALPGGKSCPPEAKELDLSALKPAELSAAKEALALLPALERIDLGSEENGLSWQQISALAAIRPEAALDYGFTLFGQALNLSDEELNFSHIPMKDEGAAVREILPLMRNCRLLDMDSCGVSTEAMAAIREDFPQIEVIWRIWFGLNYSVRTDVERILASRPSVGGNLYDSTITEFRYCTHVRYMDLGHNESLTNLDFCAYMPDLEVLVAAMNPLTDISALAKCPKLEYLELNSTAVYDLSPLAELKELRHLNIANCWNLTDMSPILGLTGLERLWIGCITRIPPEQVEAMRQAAPDCEIDVTVYDPTDGHWRYLGYIEEGGWPRIQLAPRYEKLREQFGYSDRDFSFRWNDPLY